jgi:hypothetical protein
MRTIDDATIRTIVPEIRAESLGITRRFLMRMTTEMGGGGGVGG